MNELSIKEKAQRYERAIEVINKCETDKYGCIIGVKPTDIFPELKESEDEMIRKSLAAFLLNLSQMICGTLTFHSVILLLGLKSRVSRSLLSYPILVSLA